MERKNMHPLPVYIALLHIYVAVLECIHGFEKQNVSHIMAGLLLLVIALTGLASHKIG